MRKNRNAARKLAAASGFELQTLETRVLMAASPLGVKFSAGQLTVTGTSGNDQITVSRSGNSWTINNGMEWSQTKTYKNVTKLSVNGKAGNDRITLDASVTVRATLIGEAGNDVITTAGGVTSIIGGAGNDLLTAGSATDTLLGEAGNDTLVGGAGADKLIGGAGNDLISGNGGNDLIQGGLGNDTLSAGPGNDTLDYSGHNGKQGIVLDLTSGTGGMRGEFDIFTGDFEKFTASQGHDTITGSAGADYINGLAGNDLIHGGDGNDSLFGDLGNDTIYGQAGNDRIVDGSSNDSIYGGDGDDSLYSVGGNDRLFGDAGDDELISVGGGNADSVRGGEGFDSFWTDTGAKEYILDADATEIANGAVHRIAAYKNVRNKELNGAKIADPKLTSTEFTYRSFSDRPLFATGGPVMDDINQGQVGDCYFLATIASIAKINPTRIEQSIVALGDGSYAVRFYKNGAENYVRIDADLPTYSWSTTQLAYSSFGLEGAMWAPMIEKAFAFFRKGVNTYESISAGFMSEVYSAFGLSSTTVAANQSGNASNYVEKLKNLIDAGKSVTAAVYSNPVGANLVTGHAYTVDAVIDHGDGKYSVRVRNPWGVDANSSTDGANDGYVTLTAVQAYVGLGYISFAAL